MLSFLFSALSATFLAMSFEPLALWFLAPISLAIFYYSVSKTRLPYLSAFTFGFIFNAFSLYWSGKYVGILPWLFLTILQSIFFLPLGLISYKRDRLMRIWLYPPLFLFLEELRSHFPFGGFGWNRIAYSQIDAPYAPIVRLGGVGALTLLTLYISVLIYQIASRKISILLIPIVFIAFITSLWPIESISDSNISVLAIQGNVPQVGLEFNARAKEVFYNHVKETSKALDELSTTPDFILWPENSVDVDPTLNSDVADALSEIVDSYGSPLIIGAVLNSSENIYNASIKWVQSPESIYIKRHLTPFGEYIPLRKIAEFISPYAKNVTDFSPGSKVVIHKINGVKVGPIICYELIDDKSVASMAKASHILVVQTNSATFAGTAESSQQLAITRLRALEFDRSAVSISTTGVSAFIKRNGEIASQLSEGETGYLYGESALNASITPAGRLSGGLFWINLGLALLLVLAIRAWNNADKLHYVK